MPLYIRHDDHIQVASAFPINARWAATIKLTPTMTLTAVDCRTPAPPFRSPPPLQYSVPILKSNLQKCVRRSERTAALRTAWQLLRQDPAELLRRLPVIIAEDTMIHSDLFIELVWLMAAQSKGYILTWPDANRIMSALATAISAPAQYNLDITEPPCTHIMTALQMALIIRIEFGGMEYDQAFLSRLLTRVYTETLPLDDREPVQVEEDIDDFEPSRDILLKAIDQHCFPRLIKDIPGINPQAIWWCRSSVSGRPYCGEGATEAAALAQNKFDEFAPLLQPFEGRLDSYSERKIRNGVLKDAPNQRHQQEQQQKHSQTFIHQWITRKTAAPPAPQ